MTTAMDRFIAKVEMIPISGCWIWMAAGHPTGYGRFGITSRRVEFAHRAAWTLFHGEIPVGMYVCHSCDVRLCVNPSHLFIGTAKDNMQDASRKGRIVIPKENYESNDRHQVAKLTDEQVIEIRRTTEGSFSLGRRFGVSPKTIWAARTYRSFKDVKG